MKITIAFLEQVRACQEALSWGRARPHLEGEDYQQVCTELEADGHSAWSDWLRACVAMHPATPPEALARLAGDADSDVRSCVATINPAYKKDAL